MGTKQDQHELRTALAEAHEQLQRAQRLAARAGLHSATLARVNAQLEHARECVTNVGTTLRAYALERTAPPAPIAEVLAATVADFEARSAEHERPHLCAVGHSVPYVMCAECMRLLRDRESPAPRVRAAKP